MNFIEVHYSPVYMKSWPYLSEIILMKLE